MSRFRRSTRFSSPLSVNARTRFWLSAAFALAVAIPVQAEEFGAFAGRSMDPAENQSASIEGSYKILDDGGNAIVARLNYRLNEAPTIMSRCVAATM